VKINRRQIRKLILEKFSTDDFKDVYATAQMAHMGQTRRDGSEYFTHPSEVRDIAQGFYPSDQVVHMAALLHDSLEDAPGSTVESVEEMEEFIKGSIQDPSAGEEVIRVVRALTHEKGGDYTSYVMSLLNDIPALRVKLADMVHNLSDAPRPKQKMKYKSALDAIGDQTGGNPPSGISPEHWNQLYSLVEGKKMRLTESELRLIIREEIGRSFSTNADGPIPYWKTVADDVLVTVLPIEAGTKYACEIEVPSRPEMSSPMRYFPTEEEANHFARQYTEKVKSVLFNEQA